MALLQIPANAKMELVFQQKRGELCEFEKEKAVLEIAVELDRLWEFFGAQPNNAQLQETAQLIIETYPAMDVALLQLAFKRIKTGYYGKDYKVFGQPNGQLVMSVLELVWSEHEKQYEKNIIENRLRYNGVNEPLPLCENVLALPQGEQKLVTPEQIAEYRKKLEKRNVLKNINELNQGEKELTLKIAHRIDERTEALIAIEQRKDEGIVKTLEYLKKHKPDEYDEFVKRLEQTEKELGLSDLNQQRV